MGYISNMLGEGRIENVKLGNSAQPTIGTSLTSQEQIKAAKPIVKFEELEMAYKTDSINFNAINKSTQMIMAGGFKGFINIKASAIKKYAKFFEDIGDVGNDITSEELMESLFRDQMIYGNAFIEIIFDERDEKIVDLALVDPKRIDYAKNADGKIILDKNGKEVGYMIKLEAGTSMEGDEIPKEYEMVVSSGENKIFILSKRICHFKLYAIGDRFYGTGLLTPSYKSVIYKKNIEKGQANSIYARGFSPLIAYVGNDRKMATPKDITDVLAKLKRLNYQQYDSFPNWVKVESIKYDQSDLTTSALKDLRTDQITSLSAPQALVLGSGEDTNRATLGDQRVLWEFTLKDIIKQTMSYFKKYILKPINELNDFGGVPDVEWGELRAEDVNSTADKIIRMLTAKNLHATPQMVIDLEEDLRQIMNVKASGKKPPKELIENLAGKKDNNDEDNGGLPDIQHTTSDNKGQPQKNKKTLPK